MFKKKRDLTAPEKIDVDNEKKGQKSSILKSQKPRTPLPDLDLGNEEIHDDDTGTLSRASRRVSFASSNFVKQFVQDPEKNTIWDSTYEESIEKSSDCSSNLYVPGVSILQEEDMDITLEKRNDMIESSPSMLKLEFTSQNKETLINNMEFTSQNKETLINNMEFTVIVTEKLEHPNDTVYCNSKIVTDTEILTSNRFVECRNLSIVDDKHTQMEFTKVLPVLLQENANVDVQMEFTDILCKNKPPTLSNQTIYFDTSIKNDSSVIKTAALRTENVAVKNNDTKFIEIDSNETINQSISENINTDTNNLVKENCKVLSKTGVSNDTNIDVVIDKKETSEPANLNKPKSSTQVLFSSFHGSLGEFPSCDDTQHLINYNLSGKGQSTSDFSKIIANEYHPNFLNTKYLPLNINSESFHVSLNTIDTCLKCPETEVTGGDLAEKSKIITSLTDLINMNRISERIELGKNEMNVSQTTISLASPCLEKEWIVNSVIQEMTENGISLPEPYKPNYLSITEKVKKNLAYKKSVCQIIENKLEEFQRLLSNQNKEVAEKFDTWMNDSSTDIFTDFEIQNKEPIAVLSLREKVQQLYKRNNSCWNIISLEDDVYKFNALHKSVTFIIQLNKSSGEVLHTEIEENTTNHDNPIILYLRKVFLNHFSSSSLYSALGEKFDVESFLDYLEITIQKIVTMEEDFDKLAESYAVTVNSDLSVRFTVASVKLMQIWEFNFNLNDLNNISENIVSVNVKMGHLSTSNIRKCLKGCPNGFDFIRAFIENVYNLLCS